MAEKFRIVEQAAESVVIGHPDRVADGIADSLTQAYYQQDPASKVGIEVMVTKGFVCLAGEIRSAAVNVNVEQIVRQTIKDIGYTDPSTGFSFDTVEVVNKLHSQSDDIFQGVERDKPENQGAGDQGIMIGFASSEGPDFLPLPFSLSRALANRLTKLRREGATILGPDGKTQVVIQYHVPEFDFEIAPPTCGCEEGKSCIVCEEYKAEVLKRMGEGDKALGNSAERPEQVKVKSVLISNQHAEETSIEDLRRFLVDNVIIPVVVNDYGLELDGTEIMVNPTGRFVIGGPTGDAGVTGRKLIVDNYGPQIPIGGGNSHGKDFSKQDRSGAYMARYIAKNIVASDLADACQVQLSYAIGVALPTSISIDTFGTSAVPESHIEAILPTIFDLRPHAIQQWLHEAGIDLYELFEAGAYGGDKYPWEQLNKVNALVEYFQGEKTEGDQKQE
jgi:S-adenosylmethionine synthetase